MSQAPPSLHAASFGSRNAAALVAAFGGNVLLSALPEPVASLEDAYRIQTDFVQAAGGVGGWKVSPLRPGAAPRCSPIPASFIGTPAATARKPPAAEWLVEIEIGITLGADLLPSADGIVTRDAVADAIAAIHPAIEIVTSRFAAGLDAPDLDRVADLQSCGGVLAGEGIADWRDIEFADQIAEVGDGRDIRRADAPQPSTARTLDALAWLSVHAAARGLPLRAGQTIITGARLGPLKLPAGSDATIRVGALGAIRLS